MEHTVDTQKMDALKALADTNLKISEAKGFLIKLQEIETDYLVEREKKAVARIQNVLIESRELFHEVSTNYKEVNDLCRSASEFATFLGEAFRDFNSLVKDFDMRQDLWEAEVRAREAEFAEIKKLINVDRVLLKNDQDSVKRDKELLDIAKKKLSDDQGEVRRAIKRLKENRT